MGDTGFLSLKATLRQHEHERQHLAIKLLYEAAQALSAMHSSGTVHGDLRCAHILVSPDLQTVKLSGLDHSFDWNALRYRVMAPDKTAAEVGVSVSTAIPWLAPECVAGGIPTPAADVYAFGLTVYEALTGSVPFEDKDDASVKELKMKKETQLPEARPDKIGRDAWSLIQDACNHNPIFRPSVQILMMTLRSMNNTSAVQAIAPASMHVYAPIVVTPVSSSAPVQPHGAGVLSQVRPFPMSPSSATTYHTSPTGQATTAAVHQYPMGHGTSTVVHKYPVSAPMAAPPTPVAWSPPQSQTTASPTGGGTPVGTPPAANTNQSSTLKKVAGIVVLGMIAAVVAISIVESSRSHSTSDSTSNGITNGDGNGSTNGNGNGTSNGTSNGNGNGHGNGNDNGNGNGTTNGDGNGTSNGNGSGSRNGSRSGSGSGTTNSNDNGTGNDGDGDDSTPTTSSLSSSNTKVSLVQDGFGSSWVKALTVAQNGSVFTTDGQNIYRVDESQVVRIARSSYGYQNGLANDALFDGISALAPDSSGNLFVADDGNKRLRMVYLNVSPPTVDDIAGDGSTGNRNGTLPDSSFQGLNGIAVDNQTNVYVTTNDCIRKASLTKGAVSTLQINAHSAIPIAVSPKTNEVYFATEACIIRIRADETNGEFVLGSVYPQGYRDGDASIARFNGILGLAFSLSGEDLYISDTTNNCIRIYNFASNQVSTLAGQCGSSNYGYLDGASRFARFAHPASIAVGPDGSVYVGEQGPSYGRVRRIRLVN